MRLRLAFVACGRVYVLPSSAGEGAVCTLETRTSYCPTAPVERRRSSRALLPHACAGSAMRATDSQDEDGETSSSSSADAQVTSPRRANDPPPGLDREKVSRRPGDPDCEQCSGRGEIECPVCDKRGYVSIDLMNTVSAVQCRLCQGKRIIPCPSCRAIVYNSIVWWDRIPSEDEDPEQSWQEGPNGEPRMPWTPPPV